MLFEILFRKALCIYTYTIVQYFDEAILVPWHNIFKMAKHFHRTNEEHSWCNTFLEKRFCFKLKLIAIVEEEEDYNIQSFFTCSLLWGRRTA